ncbi:MAG: hypothetical protein K6E38_03160 [Fretibacterium sp.]|nr:hypothetical protein [Fretibacterium sp.]
MAETPIVGVRPLRDGLIWVDFKSGSQVLLDLKPCLGAMRFKALESPDVWESAKAEGRFVKWYSGGEPIAELSYDELFSVMAGELKGENL